MAAPLGERLHTGCVVERVVEGRHEVTVDVIDASTLQRERWVRLAGGAGGAAVRRGAPAARSPPEALRGRRGAGPDAPWLVSNLQLDSAADRPPRRAAVVGQRALRQCRARLRGCDAPEPARPRRADGAHAPTGRSGATRREDGRHQRQRLLDQPAASWAAAVVRDLARAHADLPERVTQIDLMRYGHAMSIPVPGVRGSAALRALQQTSGRVHFAHTDLSGYSVFEEAMFQGVRAAQAVLQAGATRLNRASALRSPPAATGTPRLISSQPCAVTMASSSMRMPMFQ